MTGMAERAQHRVLCPLVAGECEPVVWGFPVAQGSHHATGNDCHHSGTMLPAANWRTGNQRCFTGRPEAVVSVCEDSPWKDA